MTFARPSLQEMTKDLIILSPTPSSHTAEHKAGTPKKVHLKTNRFGLEGIYIYTYGNKKKKTLEKQPQHDFDDESSTIWGVLNQNSSILRFELATGHPDVPRISISAPWNRHVPSDCWCFWRCRDDALCCMAGDATAFSGHIALWKNLPDSKKAGDTWRWGKNIL